jgi:hypothetical protein
MLQSEMPFIMIRSFRCVATGIVLFSSAGLLVSTAGAQQSGALSPTLSHSVKSEPLKPPAHERKSHRLIRKPIAQKNGATAEVTPSTTSQSGSALPGSISSVMDEPVTKESSTPAKSSTVAPPTTGAVSQTAPSTLFGSVSSLAPTSAPKPASTNTNLAAAAVGNAAPSAPAVPRQLGRLLSEMPSMNRLVVAPSSSAPPAPPQPVSPAISLSPLSLAFSAQQGGASPAAQTLSISNAGGGTLSWSASDNAGWLTLSPASGAGNGTVNATVALGSLNAGTYTAAITVSATGAAPVTVPVTFTVTAAPVPPSIGVSPTSLAFTAQQGGSNPASQVLSISNKGGGTLSWSVSDNAGWLTLSPASGTGNGTVTATVTIGSLAAGTYNATVTASATGASAVTVPVTFTVTAAPVPPSIGLSPTSLSFTAQQGGGNPSPKSFSISNAGGGTLSWSVTDNAGWLTLSPSSGTGNGTVTATVTTGTLTAATYTATVTVTATGAASQTVPITFTVAPASTTITLSPTTLTYSATQGGANPAAQSVTVTSNGSWTATSNVGWMTLNPSSGNGNGTISVSVNTAGVALGNNSGTITVAGGGTTKTAAVTLTLNAPSSSSAILTWNANTESDLAGYKVYRATGSGAYGAPIATIPAGTVTYSATGLQPGTTYFFVITAYDNAGNESVFSNEVSKSVF